MTDAWEPISETEIRALIEEQLQACTADDRALFDRIRIEPRKVIFSRGTLNDEVFAVADLDGKLIFYDDTEDAFEVATPDEDGSIRNAGCGQFELCHALAQLRLGLR